MADRKDKEGEYEVGYGKPPRHTQFPPGISGFKGRRKKVPHTSAEIIARVRDEMVVVAGRSISKFELAVQQVVNQTIKSGKPRDLKIMMELLEKHGAMPEGDKFAQMKRDADFVMNKISAIMARQMNKDPEDLPLIEAEQDAEAELVLDCKHCGPALRQRWARPEYVDLAKRLYPTTLHSMAKSFISRKLGT